jgi:hypothetical protein
MGYFMGEQKILTSIMLSIKNVLLISFPFLFKNKYYLTLDSYYYDKSNQLVFILQVRNKRIFKEIPVEQIIRDNTLIKEINPVDSCILGILSNLYHNKILMKSRSIQRIKKLKSYFPLSKMRPLFFIKSKNYRLNNSHMVELSLIGGKKEFAVSIFELYKNPSLMLGLDSLEALILGYDISDEWIKSSEFLKG